MHLFDQTPSDASAQPQRPLLYKPDDNDNPGAGACGDFGSLGASPDCEPYHQTPVPQGTDKIMEAAANNRNVQCAVFIDAVKTLFGPTFNPLTWGEHCFFVEPSHSLELRVNVDRDNPPGDYGKRTDLWTDRQETTINGKPAATFWDTHRKISTSTSRPTTTSLDAATSTSTSKPCKAAATAHALTSSSIQRRPTSQNR